MSKVETIRGLINDLRLATPDDPDGLMWYKPDRGSPNYFQLVPMADDADESLYYDVWVEADLTEDKAGFFHFSMKAVLYNGPAAYRMDETEIASLSFAHTDGSIQQTILNNWETAYKKRAKEAVSQYADWAEQELRGELDD